MKQFTLLTIIFFFIGTLNLSSAEKDRSFLEKILNKDLPGGAGSRRVKKEKKVINTQPVASECKNISDKSFLEKIIRVDLPGGGVKRKVCNRNAKKKQKEDTSYPKISNTDLSVYTGTFDVIDKEGDDKTSLFGMEHKNSNLFRETFLGKFTPVTGGFVTGNSSVYLYTGVEGQYDLGLFKIIPSFTPGYYEKGDGKDLGSALEFKSEIKIGFDIFENSKFGYSYSHISNNDWGETNPGTDNQQITFSKNF